MNLTFVSCKTVKNMSRHLPPLEDVLREVLPELNEPILFQNMLQNSDGSYKWKLLEWSLKELVDKFGDKKLPFRVGNHNKRTVSCNDNMFTCILSMTLSLDNFINVSFTRFVSISVFFSIIIGA